MAGISLMEITVKTEKKVIMEITINNRMDRTLKILRTFKFKTTTSPKDVKSITRRDSTSMT
jgi:hypothetical protein